MIHCKWKKPLIQLISALFCFFFFFLPQPSHSLPYYRNGSLATLRSGFIFKDLAGMCNSLLPRRPLPITISSKDAHMYIAVVSPF